MKYRNILMVALMSMLPLAAQSADRASAPDFSSVTASEKLFSLADQKGKIVVLEWTNKDCPFVKKHYSGGNMQALQKAAAADDVVWVTVVSSAPGKQGHVSAEEALAHAKEVGASPTHIIRDELGMIGKLYKARTTPTMVVIDEEGNIAYQGAIDSNSSADPDDVEGATNYVTAALASLKSGAAINTPETQSYGCGVKYAY